MTYKSLENKKKTLRRHLTAAVVESLPLGSCSPPRRPEGTWRRKVRGTI